MFVHNSSLPHVLPPRLYAGAEQYALEHERLFRPAWHPIAAAADLVRDGEFVTAELFGTPLLVRNFGGELRAFLNVCTHRHTLLTHRPKGRSPKLACQYHGWEYKADGCTGRIPDAGSFRPLPGGPERLQAFPVAVRGPLVFVRLDQPGRPEGGGLDCDDALGPAAEPLAEFPADRWRPIGVWHYDVPANWKVPVENTIESYHVPMVHPRTLVRYGAPEQITHEFFPRGAVQRSPSVLPPGYVTVADALLRRLEPGLSHTFTLHHGYPHVFVIRVDGLLQVMDVIPSGPETCRLTVRVFFLKAARPTLLSRAITLGWGKFKAALIRRILSEDAALYPDIQRGLRSSPFQGVVSVREEQIYALQRFVADTCGLPLADAANLRA